MNPALDYLPPADLRAAVKLIRASLSDAERARIAAQIDADPQGWEMMNHFSAGVHVRNLLRAHGYAERWVYAGDLDTVWAPLVELAVRDEGGAE